MDLQPGTVVGERYRLVRLIGTGGMGSVWAATHSVTGKNVAVKVLSPSHASKPEARQRFKREARAASLVRHPSVVAIHDVVEHEDTLLMVMDLLEGEDLGHRLERDVGLTLPEAARILVPVISAVGTAHAAGVVHRDLKPENIFLLDGPPNVCVLDFGIAKLTEHAMQQEGGLTSTGALLGTPYYMSPEQVFGEKDVDGRADIWSLGVILYECLSGRRPVEGDNAGQIMKAILMAKIRPLAELEPELPSEVHELVARMLIQDRNERLSDLREAFDVLAEYTDVSSQRFSRPRFTNPPQLSVAPGSGSDPYARTLTPATLDEPGPISAIRGATTEDQLERVDVAPMGRRGDALLETGHPFEMPTERARSGKLIGAVALGLLAGVVIAVGWVSTRPTDDASKPPVAATPSVQAGPTEAVPIEPGPIEPDAPAASSTPAALVEPTASASASAPTQARVAPAPARPKPSAAPQPPAGKATAELPGGIHGEVPF